MFEQNQLLMNGKRHRSQLVRRVYFVIRITAQHAVGQVKTIAISANAHTAVLGFTTGTVSVFDVRSGSIQGTLKVPEGEVLKVIFELILFF